jgi:hypothetical protein
MIKLGGFFEVLVADPPWKYDWNPPSGTPPYPSMAVGRMIREGERWSLSGWYDDEYAKVDGEWKFKSAASTSIPSRHPAKAKDLLLVVAQVFP